MLDMLTAEVTLGIMKVLKKAEDFFFSKNFRTIS